MKFWQRDDPGTLTTYGSLSSEKWTRMQEELKTPFLIQTVSGKQALFSRVLKVLAF